MVLFYILGLIFILSGIGDIYSLASGMVIGLVMIAIGYTFRLRCQEIAAKRIAMYPESKTKISNKKC